jgi:hypothetical protein
MQHKARKNKAKINTPLAKLCPTNAGVDLVWKVFFQKIPKLDAIAFTVRV